MEATKCPSTDEQKWGPHQQWEVGRPSKDRKFRDTHTHTHTHTHTRYDADEAEDIVLSAISQKRKVKHCMIPPLRHPEVPSTGTGGSPVDRGCAGRGGCGLKGAEFRFGKTTQLWR